MNWKLYEQRKQEIQQMNLTPKEYEQKIKELLKEIEK